MSGLRTLPGYRQTPPTLPVSAWLSSPATILLHSLVESVSHDLLLLLIVLGAFTIAGSVFTGSAVLTWYVGLLVVCLLKKVFRIISAFITHIRHRWVASRSSEEPPAVVGRSPIQHRSHLERQLVGLPTTPVALQIPSTLVSSRECEEHLDSDFLGERQIVPTASPSPPTRRRPGRR